MLKDFEFSNPSWTPCDIRERGYRLFRPKIIQSFTFEDSSSSAHEEGKTMRESGILKDRLKADRYASLYTSHALSNISVKSRA